MRTLSPALILAKVLSTDSRSSRHPRTSPPSSLPSLLPPNHPSIYSPTSSLPNSSTPTTNGMQSSCTTSSAQLRRRRRSSCSPRRWSRLVFRLAFFVDDTHAFSQYGIPGSDSAMASTVGMVSFRDSPSRSTTSDALVRSPSQSVLSSASTGRLPLVESSRLPVPRCGSRCWRRSRRTG